MRTSTWLPLAFLGLLVGCGNRTLPGSGDGSPPSGRDGGTPVLCSGKVCGPGEFCCGLETCGSCQPISSGIHCSPPAASACKVPGDCLVAIRVDTCCASPIPAPAASLESDPCFVPYPIKEPIPAQCTARWPAVCQTIDCAGAGPTSRLVAPAPGGCTWAAECQPDADCVLAIDHSVPTCCACPSAYPKALLDTNPCLCEAGQPCSLPPSCSTAPVPCPGGCTMCNAGTAVCRKASPAGPTAKNLCVQHS